MIITQSARLLVRTYGASEKNVVVQNLGAANSANVILAGTASAAESGHGVVVAPQSGTPSLTVRGDLWAAVDPAQPSGTTQTVEALIS